MDQPALSARSAEKFIDPDVTASGEARAHVDFSRLETLWVNTGTLCNIECTNCYIKSSPRNDRLVYPDADDIAPLISEAAAMGAREIGFTGGEPFMNPAILDMIDAALGAGFDVLVLTNAMRPMMRPRLRAGLERLRVAYGDRLTLRVSLDHFAPEAHDRERGEGGFAESLEGLSWLSRHGFRIAVAGRAALGAGEDETRAGYARLFKSHAVAIDADDPRRLVLFPEMDPARDVPEITTACWGILGKTPGDMMCATSRMAVKRKGSNAMRVLSCTLIADDQQFDMGATLAEAARAVKLNHPFCAQFCVLGGASCSG